MFHSFMRKNTLSTPNFKEHLIILVKNSFLENDGLQVILESWCLHFIERTYLQNDYAEVILM